MEKAKEFQKSICFCFIDYAKAFDWITINCGKFFKRWVLDFMKEALQSEFSNIITKTGGREAMKAIVGGKVPDIIVSDAEVDVFLEFSSFFYDLTDVGNLISSSPAVSKSSLNIWKFLVNILLKPS